MISKEIVIQSATGLHARPAGEIVKLVKGYVGCVVSLEAGGRKVNAASMLSILSLGLKQGTAVKVSAEGADEASALDAVASFLETAHD